MGTFSNDTKAGSRTGGLFRAFEAAGSAVTYAINSKVKNEKIPLIINYAILAVTIPAIWGLLRYVPAKPAAEDDLVDEVAAPCGDCVGEKN